MIADLRIATTGMWVVVYDTSSKLIAKYSITKLIDAHIEQLRIWEEE